MYYFFWRLVGYFFDVYIIGCIYNQCDRVCIMVYCKIDVIFGCNVDSFIKKNFGDGIIFYSYF